MEELGLNQQQLTSLTLNAIESSFCEKEVKNKVRLDRIDSRKDSSSAGEYLTNDIIKKLPDLKEMIDNQELNYYIKEVINFSFNSNKYFNDLEPWKLKKK